MSKILQEAGSTKPVFMPWKEHYGLGHHELDTQRKRFLSIINDLHASLEAKHEDKAIKAVIDRLAQYSKWYFGREEELMKRHGFPDLANHRLSHNHFAQETLQLSKMFPGAVTGPELLRFLKSWWVSHACEEDKRCVPYLSQRERCNQVVSPLATAAK
jgi:hemerythrin-like metal-binding protein